MAAQQFGALIEGPASLLDLVEATVIDGHRRTYEAAGRPWSRPIAYRWLRYEDPKPVQRLLDGVRRLAALRATFESVAVDKALERASLMGFPN